MTRRWKFSSAAAVLATAGLALAGCSSTGTDQSTRPSGSAAPVDAAQSVFCKDLGSYLQVIDRYGRVFHEEQTTVGDLKAAGADLVSAEGKVKASATQLADSITAANRAAQATTGSGSTTTVLLKAKTADEHTQAVTAAVKDLKDTAEGVDASTPLRSAVVDLQAAAFGVEQAYVSLFVDAGCLTDSPSAARAVDAYVTGLQQDLATLGYYSGTVDGLYGSQTVSAIKALQHASNLPETGVVDPATEAALDKALKAKGTQESLNIAALQGALTATGDYSGPIDGTWSPAVEQALVSYQQSQKLPPTGKLDAETLAALLRNGADDSTTTTTSAPSSSVAPSPTTTAKPTTTTPPTTKAP